MTKSDAERTSRGRMRLAMPAAVAIAALALAGCESSGSSLFSSLTSGPETTAPEPPKQAAQQAPLARIALAPVIGAPDAVSRQIAEQVVQSAERHRISLINDRDAKGDFTLRGYIVASKDRSQTKVSYIWDMTDPTGKRVHRVTGEEMAPAGTGKDPWAAVTGALTQSIADKTATQLATWVAANRPAGAGAAPIASQPASAAPDSTGAQRPIAAVAPPAAPAPEPASARTTTASLPPSGDVAAIVPTVNGAPGDGNSALSSALQRELSRQGVTMANRPGASYRIEGKVALAQGQAGKQTIQIDWLVRDPQGRSLGTVSQKNEIPEGSLDSAWGSTADAAAGAAAQGIIKLLPQGAARAVN